ncbi:MAG: ZIP family zinc transporter [Methanobrevibacter sp.]|jgi:ZIP family zinc transporter|nr:ZIP family zinc transporter [Candidatus Methanoflexus mossambicus]
MINYLNAFFWGIIGSSALILGAVIGYYLKISEKLIAALSALSAGILSSAVCFELLYESYSYGGFYPVITGFFIGVIAFTTIDYSLHHLNKRYLKNKNNLNIAKYLKNEEKRKKKENISNKLSSFLPHNYKTFNKYQIQSLVTIAGALLDGIPESIAIGLVLIIGGPISMAMVIAVFISNSFEGITSATNMKLGGWNKKFIFGVWIFITIATGLSAMLGYTIFSQTDHHILSFALAIAAGALISMIADVLLPEAYEKTHEFTGFLMALGFLLSFILSHLK